MKRSASILLLLLASIAVEAQTITGKVVKVFDGDSFHLLVDTGKVRIRLHGIDCPERRHAFGWDARNRSAALILNKTVRVQVHSRDLYGRTVGIVTTPDGCNLAECLLLEGLAVVDTRFDTTARSRWLQRIAEDKHLGLWR